MTSIHLFIFYHRLNRTCVVGVLEIIPAILGRWQDTPWTSYQFIVGPCNYMFLPMAWVTGTCGGTVSTDQRLRATYAFSAKQK